MDKVKEVMEKYDSGSTTLSCSCGSTLGYSEEFTNFVLRLGGMHLLMSFCGAVGTLLEGSSIAEILRSTFGGVNKMLTGKKFPEKCQSLPYGSRRDVEKFILGQ